MLIGQVVKVISGFYDVFYNNKIFRLRASGSLRDNKINPLVGDYVEFVENGLLLNVLERKNSLIRPKVANIDQVAIVCSLNEPKFSSLLLDRFLAMIEVQRIKPIIIFTKPDLGNIQPYHDYLSQKYDCFLINNKESALHNDLKKNLENKLTVFTGQTGVGKSTTINNLFNLDLKTNEISKSLGRGKHTTRVVEIFQIGKFKIIDTPGFGSIQINLSKTQLSKAYFDFNNWSKKCKFNSCLHYKEDYCFIKKQLDKNILLKSRYDNYIKILLEDTIEDEDIWKKNK